MKVQFHVERMIIIEFNKQKICEAIDNEIDWVRNNNAILTEYNKGYINGLFRARALIETVFVIKESVQGD